PPVRRYGNIYFTGKIEGFDMEMSPSAAGCSGDRRMKKKGEPKHAQSVAIADINVTPMVDVMLVMLIIFMVITPMLVTGVRVELVKARNPISMQAQDKSDAITCSVTRDS